MILSLHLVIVGIGLGGAWLLGIPFNHLGFGFIFGVALYSMYWRHIYGFWPEKGIRRMKSIRIALLGLFFGFGAQAAEINDLNIVDSSNTARFPEGMAPGDVNDSARALEGIMARWYGDENCSTATTGSSNAYVLAANQTLSAYYDGLLLCFDANHSNTSAATLNVDSLGAKTIKKFNDQDVESGDIDTGQKVIVVYDGTNFQLLSAVSAGNFAVTDADNNFSADQTIVGTDAGAAEGPGLNLHRDSASPAVSDLGPAIRLKCEDTTSAEWTCGKFGPPTILDPNDGSEDSAVPIATTVAGTLDDRFWFGQGFYADGNTDPGVGGIDADVFKLSGEQVEATKLDTVQATTSGTEYDFTSPFATTTRIEVLFDGISASGTDEITVQIGPTGGLVTSGYIGNVGRDSFVESFGAGFQVNAQAADSGAYTGVLSLLLQDSANNIWIGKSDLGLPSTSISPSHGGGRVALSGAITQLRVKFTGSDTGDAGSVNVRWYGY